MPTPSVHSRIRRGVAFAALGVLILLAFLTVRVGLGEPAYAFSCDGVTDPIEVGKLLRFADECERLRRWTPDTATDAAIVAATEHLQSASNRSANRWNDLYRTGSDPGLTVLNGTLALLTAVPDAELPQLRALPSDTLRQRLRRELDAVVQRQRDDAICERLHDPTVEPLLARLGDKPYPQSTCVVRTAVCSVCGKPIRDRERWIDGLLKAIDQARPELTRILGVYERVARTTEVMPAGAHRGGLVFRRLNYADPTLHSVNWNRDRSTADWTVGLRIAAEPGTWIERDVGLRIYQVAFADSDAPQLAWPPPIALAADEELTTFLRAYGLPGSWTLHADSVRGEGEAANPQLVVAFTVRSPDATDWRWSGRLRLDDNTDVESEVRATTRQAFASLRNHLPHARTYRRLPVKFQTTSRDAETLTCRFDLGLAPSVRMRCRLDEDGRLSWLGAENLSDSAALAPWLAARHAELAPIAERLVVGRIDPSREPGVLEGTLTPPDRTVPAIAWRVTSEGLTTFEIPDGWKDAARRLGVSPPTLPLERATAVRAALEAELKQRHPLLAEHAEIATSPSGLCSLGVHIDDWPLLRLGPTVVRDPSEVGAALDRLLDAQNVRDSASIQWEAVQHPRYGTVRPEIADWSADDGRATIHCVAPLWPNSGEKLTVAWREKTWLNLDGWKRDTIDIPQQIERARDGILDKVNQLLGQRLGPSDYLLTVEPDTTEGALSWLSLRPFSIKLRARLRVKRFDLVVVMAGARLDHAGLHLPDDYHVTIERTLPTPYCALSDPTLRVHLKKQSLALGCKATPPLVPILGLGSDGKPTAEQVRRAYGLPKAFPVVRLDNPWLHLIYLRGEFGGQLREPRLHAEADLRLLEFIDAARGTAVLIPRENRLEAQLRVGSPLSGRVGLPLQLDGEALFTPPLTQMRGKLRLAGLASADATARILTRERPVRLRLDASAEMPVLGAVQLHGETDATLKTYRLRGEGRLTASWLNGEELLYIVEVSDGRLAVDFRREKAGKVARVRIEGPDASVLNESNLRERLKGLTDEELRPASSDEIQLAARLAAAELHPLSPEPSEEAAEVVVQPTPMPAVGPGTPRAVANVECFAPRDGGSWQFRYYDQNDLPKDVGYALKSKVSFEHPSHCVFRSWVDPKYDDRFTLTLVFDVRKRRISLLHWEAGWVKTSTDVTDRFAALGELFPTGKDHQLRSEMVQDFIATHTDLTLRGNRILGDVRRVGGGFLLEYEPNGLPDRRNAIFTWRGEGGAFTARLFEPFVSRQQRDEALYARLERLRPQRRNLLVVAVESGATGRIATLEPIGGGSWELRPDGNRDKLTLKDLDGSATPLPELAHRLATATWRRTVPSEATEAVLVAGGALLSSKEGFWLVPASSLLNRDWTERPFFVSWDAFRRWDSESVRLLHPDWRSAKTRAAATPEQIARTFLRDWDVLRTKEPGWAANPLGLLIGLAERRQEVARGR